MKIQTLIILGKFVTCLAIVTLFTGCPMSEKSPIGFRLPKGNVDSGKAEFVKLGCLKCHSVKGVDMASELTEEREADIVLGGEVSRIKTYGHLVTSIINPSHVVSRQYREQYTDDQGKSIMPDFSKEMSVRQMIDLTEFLQAHYEVVVPEEYYYNTY